MIYKFNFKKMIIYKITLMFLILGGSVEATVISFKKENDTIMKTYSPEGWIIKTRSSAYQLIIDKNGKIKPVFYGAIAQAEFGKKNSSWFEDVDEIPVRGGFPDKIPMLEVIFEDNVRDVELQYVSGDIINIEGRPTLKIIQKDKFYPLEVTSYIRVFDELDMMEKWIEVRNTSKKQNIKIENLQSGSIVLPANEYLLKHMTGKWGHEFQPVETELTMGIKTLQSKNFKSSLSTPPFYLVKPKNKNDSKDLAWFGTIQYSGNWRIDFEKFYDGNVQIVSGINFWDTDWNLKPGAIFTTPKAILGYTEKGSEGAAQAMSAYIRTSILPEVHRNDLRPILYNSWYATEFEVNEAHQLALAEIAKEIGVEMFVIDDGWFKGRVNDHAGLGDWEVDKTKFPNGLNPLIKKINDMGMQFGIWVEPEMVNPDSDLYRKHPDWVFHFPNRKRNEGRNQLMLNLAKEDVYQYLLKSMTQLLQVHDIDFIKWDHNRILSEPGWLDVPEEIQREARIRYVDNLYRLIEELKIKFPDVWFENCSSGGGRVDLGMMARMDQAWVSDNTDPLDRIFIQYGYLNMFPANTMVSWVTDENHHQILDLDFKFDVSMSGVLGIGNDLSKWGEEEKRIAKEKIRQYKIIRPIVQQGITYRLISPFEENRSALQYLAKDNHSTVVFCYNMAEYLAHDKPNLLKLKGLNPSELYYVESLGSYEDKQSNVYKGDFLMEIGVPWPIKGANKSKILLIKSK